MKCRWLGLTEKNIFKTSLLNYTNTNARFYLKKKNTSTNSEIVEFIYDQPAFI